MTAARHLQLAELNRDRLTPVLPGEVESRDELAHDHQRATLEHTMLEAARAEVAARAVAAPRDADAFVAWFSALEATGPGQHDQLFSWLAEHATLAELRWFLRQEVAGEAEFDDLALAQLGMLERAQLELARNYWDELGRGNPGGMHGPMLARLADALDIDALAASVPAVWESLALGNVMLALAANRRYRYHALGALGVLELTAPGRATLVNAALERLAVSAHARQYVALHATLDVKHSAALNAQVPWPMIDAHPEAAPAVAEGELTRLEAGRRCFERYGAEFGLQIPNQTAFARAA